MGKFLAIEIGRFFGWKPRFEKPKWGRFERDCVYYIWCFSWLGVQIKWQDHYWADR